MTKSKPLFFLLRAITAPISDIGQNLRNLGLLILPFALISLIISYLFEQTFSCQFFKNVGTCPNIGVWYIPYGIIKMLLFSYFIDFWYVTAYLREQPFSQTYLKRWRPGLRNFFILLGLIGCATASITAGFALIRRVPNPNWIIELLYFTALGAILILPIGLIRANAFLGDLIAGNGFKNFKKIWIGTKGKGLKIVVSSMLIFLFCIFLVISIIGGFNKEPTNNVVLIGVAGEFLLDAVFFLITTLLTSYVHNIRVLALEAEAQNNTSDNAK